MSKKSHHFLTLWPWPLTYDLEKLIRSGHYHYQCVYQIWEQSIPWFLSYRVNTIAGGGQRAAGGGRLRRKTITSPDPSDTGDIIIIIMSVFYSANFNSDKSPCSKALNNKIRVIMRYDPLKIGTDDVGPSQWWRWLNRGADIITGLSRRHPCRFSRVISR